MNNRPFIQEISLQGTINSFNLIAARESRIYLILGMKGSGKTALGFRLMENLGMTKNKKMFAYGFPGMSLPLDIIKIDDFQALENNSILIIDEGGLSFDAKNHFSFNSRQLKTLMALSRHKGIDLIVISQNSSSIDLNIIRMADVVIFKELSLMQIEMERPQIAKLCREAAEYFKGRYAKKFAFIVSKEFKGLVRNCLSSFWNEQISTGFSEMVFEKEKIKEVE